MSAAQMVCIRRPEPALSSIFEDMYLNERLVDVTLSCMDGQLQAHKLVLAASSQYFSSLFEKLPNPFHYPVIVIKDMRIEDLKMIVDFMYRGQLTVSQDRLLSLVKCAENLQITGLSNIGEHDITKQSTTLDNHQDGILYVDSYNDNDSRPGQRTQVRKSKKSSMSSMPNPHHAIFGKAVYQQRSRQEEIDYHSSSQPEKLLEQSMITGDSLEDGHSSQHFQTCAAGNDPTLARSLNNQQLHSPSQTSMHHVQQQLANIDPQQCNSQHLSNRLQVLSHSLTANRSSLNQGITNGQQSISQLAQQTMRHRGFSCYVCRKIFKEKANLTRHLQIHSLTRNTFTCRECSRTFLWKDNYIRHTKTAHHISNVRPET